MVQKYNVSRPTVDWSKLEIVLYTLFVLSCTTKLTGLYRTVPTFCRVPLSLPRLHGVAQDSHIILRAHIFGGLMIAQ